MMITTFDISRQENVAKALASIRSRSAVPPETVSSVQEIIDAVRDGGDKALLRFAQRYDGVQLDASRLEVTPDERRIARDAVDGKTREVLSKAERRIAFFARESLAQDWHESVSPGLTVGQEHRPLETVGIYIPGGRFAYPSTVLMTGVLAREAGVKNVIFCVPPDADGSVSSLTLAATSIVGEYRVFKAGGAQAIAAMAFGTETVPGCQMVSGPGNIYVATAKRLLSGVVKVDIEAGPSEVAAYVDASVDVSFPAADMLAQLEHDPLAVAVMVSESSAVLESARGVIEGFAQGLRKDLIPEGTINLVRCASRELALGFLNELAPEHLELMVEDADKLLSEITAAGCVFVGPFSTVALGDYLAGPSHVLPTAGTAARLSGLRADDFRRAMNVVSYTREGFESDAPEARLLATLEGLRNHALSLDVRNR